MAPYAESLENPDMLGFSHTAEGLACVDCHELEQLTQLHAQAVPGDRVTVLMIENDLCFDCHIENEHTSNEQVAERTADYVIEGELLNPHDPHAALGKQEKPLLNCASCHKMHKQSPLLNGCKDCHHIGTYEACVNCH